MIKTQKEYRDTLRAIDVLANETLPDETERLKEAGVSADSIRRLLGPIHARIAQLRADATIFERIRNGDLSMFDDAEDFGRLLIAARIARGWSQRDFARALGVHESQVSRDERTEYEGISLDRFRFLCNTLELELRSRPGLMHAVAEHAFEDVSHRSPAPALHGSSVHPAVPAAAQHIATSVTAPSISSNPVAELRSGLKAIHSNAVNAITHFVSGIAGPTGPTGPTGLNSSSAVYAIA